MRTSNKSFSPNLLLDSLLLPPHTRTGADIRWTVAHPTARDALPTILHDFHYGGWISSADRAGKERSDTIDKQIAEDCKRFKREFKIILLGTPFSTGPTVLVVDWFPKVQASWGRVQSYLLYRSACVPYIHPHYSMVYAVVLFPSAAPEIGAYYQVPVPSTSNFPPSRSGHMQRS